MHSPEFRKKALRITDKRGGPCLKASRELGAVSPKTLQRWRDERRKRPRKRHAHLSRSQEQSIAKQLEQGKAPRVCLIAMESALPQFTVSVVSAVEKERLRSWTGKRE